MAVDLTPFIQGAQESEALTGIPASITLAQIMLESGGKYQGGLSGLAYNDKNLFGMKGQGTAGSSYYPSGEYVNGKYVTQVSAFRKYNSYEDSILDHAKLLTRERYSKHLVNAKSIDDFAHGIKAGGYATDPNYADKLISIIGKNNLTQYDKGTYQYKGGSGLSSVNPSTGTGSKLPTFNDYKPNWIGTGQTATANQPQYNNQPSKMVEGVAEPVSIFLMVILLLVGGVLFFMRAFPATQTMASAIKPK